jgi:hypothetical protein
MFSDLGKSLAFVATVALLLSAGELTAQPGAKKSGPAKTTPEAKATSSAASTAQDNTVPDIAAPAAPSAGEQAGIMSGNKPFSLTTDTDGELLYNFNDANELDSITAKKGVVFSSEDMSLKADQLDFSASKSELIATGERVVVRMGETIATCQLFKYFAETQRSELTGNPLLYSKSKDGKTNTTSGDKIEITTVNGKAQVKVIGGGRRGPVLRNLGAESVAAPGLAPASPNNGAQMTMTQGAAGGAGHAGAAVPMMGGQ